MGDGGVGEPRPLLRLVPGTFRRDEEGLRPGGGRQGRCQTSRRSQTRWSLSRRLFHRVPHVGGWVQLERGGSLGYDTAWAGRPGPEGDLHPRPSPESQRAYQPGAASGCSPRPRGEVHTSRPQTEGHGELMDQRGRHGQSRRQSRAYAGRESSAFPGGEREAEIPWTMPLLWRNGPFHTFLSSKRASPVVMKRLLSGGISAEKSSPSTLLPVRLRWANHTHTCQALLDSGAEGNFMDLHFAHKLHLPIIPLTRHIFVNALNGQELPNISLTTGPITLITSSNHTEIITFLVMDSPLAHIVLGHPWLVQHNPRVDWSSNSTSTWSERYYESCLVSACSSVSGSVFQEKAADLSNMPMEYLDLKEVFSKSRAASLPQHRPYDCAIDLLPGKSPPKGKLYSLFIPDREAMEKYISDSLAAGFIRPSSSPAGAGFFFVGKKDGSLRPCIDYRELNNITVKNTYPLPLMSSAFERLQGASVFTKLDLRNAYHLVRIRKGDERKTAFNTPRGHFEYLVMPFGLSNSPAVFQALVNDMLRDMVDQFIYVYLDDI